jgi:hypothetical protein
MGAGWVISAMIGKEDETLTISRRTRLKTRSSRGVQVMLGLNPFAPICLKQSEANRVSEYHHRKALKGVKTKKNKNGPNCSSFQ